jgi:hypothetical protein
LAIGFSPGIDMVYKVAGIFNPNGSQGLLTAVGKAVIKRPQGGGVVQAFDIGQVD